MIVVHHKGSRLCASSMSCTAGCPPYCKFPFTELPVILSWWLFPITKADNTYFILRAAEVKNEHGR
jgi:hypothetical protein